MLKLRVEDVALSKRMYNKAALAARAGINENTLNAYWTNRITRLDVKVLAKIAKALGVKPLDLLYDDEEEEVAEEPEAEHSLSAVV